VQAQPCHIPWIKWEPQIGYSWYYSCMKTREIYWGTSFLHLTSVDDRNSGPVFCITQIQNKQRERG
jgi:hypothetical protein